MSADKYAQFIAEQQRKLSVSGTNPVDLDEKKELSRKQKEIAKLAGDPDEIEGEDFGRLRAMKKEDVESLDELKKRTYASYVGKAAPEVLGHAYAAGMTNTNDPKTKEKSFRKAFKRVKGIERATKRLAKEEVESLDEVGDTKKGQKLLGKVRKRATGRLIKATDPMWKSGMSDDDRKTARKYQDVGRMADDRMKEEVELISIEESAYLEEMVGKGKLPDILAHHKNNMMYHSKMYDHHNMMADKSEQVGDGRGFDLHIDQSMEHEYQYQHHKNRYDHAVGLKTRSKAQKEMKSASEAMSAASKKVADAKALKREY